MNHSEVQNIAKSVMKYLKEKIRAGMSLKSLRELAEAKLMELGATDFWYYGIGAFVFSGEETVLSLSGRNYVTPDRLIEENDIVTVDLSPQVGDVWGDYARTIIIENGRAICTSDGVNNREWHDGLITEEKLHRELLSFAAPEMTFEQLYKHMNEFISAQRYVNLDFAGNLGHSIEKRKEDRIYIERGNSARLDSVKLFTFEPHIKRAGGRYGFKKENIYYFDGGVLKEL